MVTITVYKRITEANSKGKPFACRMPALDKIRYVGEVETSAKPRTCYGESIAQLAKVVALNIKDSNGDIDIKNDHPQRAVYAGGISTERPLERNELTRFKTCLMGVLEKAGQTCEIEAK